MIRITQVILGFKKKYLANLFANCPELVHELHDGLFEIPEEIANYYKNKYNYFYLKNM